MIRGHGTETVSVYF